MIIEHWKDELRRIGFIDSIENNSLIYNRNIQGLRQKVWEVSNRFNNTEYFIYLGIHIIDEFDTNNTSDTISLTGNLQRDKTYFCDFQLSPVWWKCDETELALKSYLSNGLEWFDKYSNIEQLIKYFEKDWLLLKKSIVKNNKIQILDRLIGNRNTTVRIVKTPPIHSYYLSLLYYSLGDNVNASKYAKLWLDYVENTSFIANEPERTLHLLKVIDSHNE